jgi:two-component system cell cycle response regulator DivK
MPTVLIVEDDHIARIGLATLLQSHGFQTVEATDAGEAIELIHSGSAPDVILLDMILRGRDGWTFLGQRRHDRVLAAAPLVIMTGLGIASDEWARSLGAVCLLRKPIDVDALLATVGNLTQSRSPAKPGMPSTAVSCDRLS